MISGVLVLDKPVGPTSHDVVARVRRLFQQREVGHAGTLDPMASGVLVIALGEGTKLVPYLTGQTKSYETLVRLGIETHSLDAQGHITREEPLSLELLAHLGAADSTWILKALSEERARTAQVPPSVSAIHDRGERAHARVRRGEEVVLEPRGVQVDELSLVGTSAVPPTVGLRLTVSKGYYVRALARDLCAQLGTVGHLTALRRLASGPFRIEDAGNLDASAGELEARVIPLGDVARSVLGHSDLTAAGSVRARQGKALGPEDFSQHVQGISAWFSPTDELVAIGEIAWPEAARVRRGFRPAPEDATPARPSELT